MISRRNVAVYAYALLGISFLSVTALWFAINTALVGVMDIPLREVPDGSQWRQGFVGVIPFPTPWWIGAVMVLGYAALMVQSWKPSRDQGVRAPVRIAAFLMAFATWFFAGTALAAATYFGEPDEPSVGWLFVATGAAGIAVVATGRAIFERRQFEARRVRRAPGRMVK